MRIMSLRVAPVARILAIMYAILSPFLIILALLTKAEYIRIPLGIVAPLIYFNINFDLQTPTHFFSGAALMLLAAICYAATGWLTGAAAVLSFNFFARRMGGIDAFVLSSDPVAAKPVD
jgi:hypothetical protein